MPLVSAAGLVDALRDYRILEPAQLLPVRDALAGGTADARAVARDLIDRGLLTPYQANHLLQGRGAELVLGEYLLLERLGEGGMGQVFKARHQTMNRTVALKVIRKEQLDHPEAVRRFRREIRLAAQLDHPHLVRAHDASQVGDTHFLVMEFAEGSDLQHLVEQSGPLPLALACDYIRQAALGLHYASEGGLVHRDVKPSNLQVTGRGTVVKVLDLGLARSLAPAGGEAGQEGLTRTRSFMGTPDYVAPEQIADARGVDVRADIYSLGCSFYFLLAGRPPFPDAAWEEKLVCHRKVEPQPIEQLRPDVPPALALILRKMMAKQPSDRYAPPAAVADALGTFSARAARAAAVACAVQGASPTPGPTTCGLPTSDIAPPAWQESGWSLQAHSTICPPESPSPPAQPLAAPTVQIAAQPTLPQTTAPPSLLPTPAQPRPTRGRRFGVLLASCGVVLALSLLTLTFLWPNSRRDPVAIPNPPLGAGKAEDAETAVLLYEDFRKPFTAGRALPDGWTNPAFSVVEGEDHLPCLEVNEKGGEPLVELPLPTLRGNFFIECEYLLDADRHRLTLRLEDRQGERPLSVVVDGQGVVTIDNFQPRPGKNTTYLQKSHFRLNRKEDTLIVWINGKTAAVTPLTRGVEYDKVCLGLTGGPGTNHHLAQVYKLKVGTLPRSRAPDAARP